nr:MAG TPA: hypothetical protein [Caudoviricetes sp.]
MPPAFRSSTFRPSSAVLSAFRSSTDPVLVVLAISDHRCAEGCVDPARNNQRGGLHQDKTLCRIFFNPGLGRISQRTIVERRVQNHAKGAGAHQVRAAHDDSAIRDHRFLDVIQRVNKPVVIQPEVKVTPAAFVDSSLHDLRARINLVTKRAQRRKCDGVILDGGIESECTPRLIREDQVSGDRTGLFQESGLPDFDIIRRLGIGRAGGNGQRPFVRTAQGDSQVGSTTKIHHFGFIAFPGNRDGSGHQRAGGHPLQTTVDHVDLVSHFKLQIQHFTFGGGVFTTNSLADLATNRFTQIRGALVFDVSRFERIGLVFTGLDQLALHQRRDKRRHTTQADININRHFFSLVGHDIREEAIEQPVLTGFQVRNDLYQHAGIINIFHIQSLDNASCTLAKIGMSQPLPVKALGQR